MPASAPRIALVIDIDWPYKHHQGVITGILSYGREKSWICELAPFLGLPDAGTPKTFDGIVGRATPQLSRFARARGIPAVNVWVNSPDQVLPRVLPDQVAAGVQAANHFVSRGLRRFGFLGQRADVNCRFLLQGFTEILQARRYSVTQQYVGGVPQRAQEWRAFQHCIARWIEAWSVPIGVFCSSDVLARYLIDCCLHHGLRVPEDVAVIGTGNTELTCEMSEPRLSSIEQSYERVGWQAAALLDRLLRGEARVPAVTFVQPAGLVTRTSTDAFAVEDPDVAKALRVIQERSREPVSVADILDVVPLSRRTLERRFQEILGCTIHDEIVRAYVERAKHLLVSTRHPLKWIAARAGFSSSQRLNKVFRAVEALSPNEYRLRHGKSNRARVS